VLEGKENSDFGDFGVSGDFGEKTISDFSDSRKYKFEISPIRDSLWGYISDQLLLLTTHPGLREGIGRSKGQRATHGFMSGFMGSRQKRAKLFGIRKMINFVLSKFLFSKIHFWNFLFSKFLFSGKDFLSHFSHFLDFDGDLDLFLQELVFHFSRSFSCGLLLEFLLSFASEESRTRRENTLGGYKKHSYRRDNYENDFENDSLIFILFSSTFSRKSSGFELLSIGWLCNYFSGEIWPESLPFGIEILFQNFFQ
jgi:hypothetical protein